MRLYRVRYDGGEAFVEAENFGTAINVWREAMLAEFADEPDSGWDETSEPESVELISDDPVLRG